MLEIAYIAELNQTNGLIEEMLNSNFDVRIAFHKPKQVFTESSFSVNSSLDLVIFDLNTAHGYGNVADNIQHLNQLFSDSPLLVIHPYDGKKFVQPLIEAGANGIIPVAPTEEVVTQAINEILAGKNYVSLS